MAKVKKPKIKGTKRLRAYRSLVSVENEVAPKPTTNRKASTPGKKPALADRNIYNKIIRRIENGNYPAVAAAESGISYDQLLTYLRKGKAGESKLYHRFYCDVQKAEAIAEARQVQTLQRQAKDEYRANLELLERRWPSRWAKRTSQDINVSIQGEVDHKHTFADKVKKDPNARSHMRQLVNAAADIIDAEFEEVPNG